MVCREPTGCFLARSIDPALLTWTGIAEDTVYGTLVKLGLLSQGYNESAWAIAIKVLLQIPYLTLPYGKPSTLCWLHHTLFLASGFTFCALFLLLRSQKASLTSLFKGHKLP